MATKVPAHYTSQSCVKCGHTSKAKRPNKGLLFRCECCGYELHSDLLGSRDIALRTLLVRQDWMRRALCQCAFRVSGDETEAEILQRFLELRWSLDASSHCIVSPQAKQS